ncbi:hypothetical protein PPERSA_02599 [Pseudocohnilembus persalinus]|uniref:Uncharacterized protein n=1 Tax=Pseudocohnilembus persalinus TaxID=266149 RepID=A0A0V0R5F9_PSEPJ|nr:hypothetical protein PPERSA_02599 [Pseudocohnilembus persalinus]|eukprot:KRX09727.1 hypothetical protein PPERSA_02599 [Pseudocohnilembus persalinus]
MEIQNKISNLPLHTEIKIQFNVHFFDNWEGEVVYSKLDENFIWSQGYNWCDKFLPETCQKQGINVCGQDKPDKLSNFVQFQGKHSSSEINLTIGSNINKDPCTASWGIDDIMIFIL